MKCVPMYFEIFSFVISFIAADLTYGKFFRPIIRLNGPSLYSYLLDCFVNLKTVNLGPMKSFVDT